MGLNLTKDVDGVQKQIFEISLPRLPFSILARALTCSEIVLLSDSFGPDFKIKSNENLDILIYKLLKKMLRGWNFVTLTDTSLNKTLALNKILKNISSELNDFEKRELIKQLLIVSKQHFAVETLTQIFVTDMRNL